MSPGSFLGPRGLRLGLTQPMLISASLILSIARSGSVFIIPAHAACTQFHLAIQPQKSFITLDLGWAICVRFFGTAHIVAELFFAPSHFLDKITSVVFHDFFHLGFPVFLCLFLVAVRPRAGFTARKHTRWHTCNQETVVLEIFRHDGICSDGAIRTDADWPVYLGTGCNIDVIAQPGRIFRGFFRIDKHRRTTDVDPHVNATILADPGRGINDQEPVVNNCHAGSKNVCSDAETQLKRQPAEPQQHRNPQKQRLVGILTKRQNPHHDREPKDRVHDPGSQVEPLAVVG